MEMFHIFSGIGAIATGTCLVIFVIWYQIEKTNFYEFLGIKSYKELDISRGKLEKLGDWILFFFFLSGGLMLLFFITGHPCIQ